MAKPIIKDLEKAIKRLTELANNRYDKIRKLESEIREADTENQKLKNDISASEDRIRQSDHNFNLQEHDIRTMGKIIYGEATSDSKVMVLKDLIKNREHPNGYRHGALNMML